MGKHDDLIDALRAFAQALEEWDIEATPGDGMAQYVTLYHDDMRLQCLLLDACLGADPLRLGSHRSEIGVGLKEACVYGVRFVHVKKLQEALDGA